jgi:hypothetical protein
VLFLQLAVWSRFVDGDRGEVGSTVFFSKRSEDRIFHYQEITKNRRVSLAHLASFNAPATPQIYKTPPEAS